MSDHRHERGFSLVEIVIVAATVVVVGAVAVPVTGNALTEFRLSGDARALANWVSVAKMRAAANFTKVRLFADLADNGYVIQTWNKTTGAWDPSSGMTYLSQDDAWGAGDTTNAPPNTQPSIGQAPACLNAAGEPIGNSACITFNSRGVPVDSTNTPTAGGALYITNGGTVFGTTVSATGLVRLWRAQTTGGTVSWELH